MRIRNGTWVPVDGYAALQSDVYFRNVVMEKLVRPEGFYMPICERYLAAATSVLEEVDAQIARLTS